MPRRNVVVGLDIGTTKVAAVMGEVTPEGRVNILGVGECPSGGMRKGNVVDIEHMTRSITEAVERVERMSGLPVNSVYVGLTGPHLATTLNKSVVAVTGQDREITLEDAQRVLQAARVISLPAERRILHVLPREFSVDGCSGVIDPVGMAGSRLEVETLIITGLSTSVQNIMKSLQRAGLQAEEVVANPLASAEAVLLPAEKELGVVIVDIGGGTTEVAIYDQGSLWYASVLPLGGDLVTSDLAVGLRTPLAGAEEIKKKHGAVLASLQPEEECLAINSVGGQETRQVSRRLVASIIEPRLQEIFALVKETIKQSGYKGMLPGGVVLTGGTSQLAGLVQLVGAELDMPVRLGLPQEVGGMADIINGPEYATGIGLVLWGARSRQAEYTSREDPLLGGLVGRIRSWLRDFV